MEFRGRFRTRERQRASGAKPPVVSVLYAGADRDAPATTRTGYPGRAPAMRTARGARPRPSAQSTPSLPRSQSLRTAQRPTRPQPLSIVGSSPVTRRRTLSPDSSALAAASRWPRPVDLSMLRTCASPARALASSCFPSEIRATTRVFPVAVAGRVNALAIVELGVDMPSDCVARGRRLASV